MILLDPGVDQTLGPQGSQSQVGGGGGSISSGAALEEQQFVSNLEIIETILSRLTFIIRPPVLAA